VAGNSGRWRLPLNAAFDFVSECGRISRQYNTEPIGVVRLETTVPQCASMCPNVPPNAAQREIDKVRIGAADAAKAAKAANHAMPATPPLSTP
jgi:hypothetical protein